MTDLKAFDAVVKVYYKTGLSAREIARGLQVSIGKVSRSLKRTGIGRTRSQAAWLKRTGEAA